MQLQKKRVDDNIRMIDPSYDGVADILDTGSGATVGLTVAIKGHIDKNGVIRKDPNKVTASDFIPYKEHLDPLRATMAVSQIRQAVPIAGGEDPKVSTTA